MPAICVFKLTNGTFLLTPNPNSENYYKKKIGPVWSKFMLALKLNVDFVDTLHHMYKLTARKSMLQKQ